MKESRAAIAVAKEVLATIGKGEIPVIEKIAIEKGYSKTTARAGRVQATKSYKKTVKPFAQRLEKHRERILKRMEETVNQAEYNELSSSLERTTKVIQLLTGGATEQVLVVEVAKEIALKRGLAQTPNGLNTGTIDNRKG